jgi:hypothetical protein
MILIHRAAALQDATRVGYAAYREYENARDRNLPEWDNLSEGQQAEYAEMAALFAEERGLARVVPAPYRIFRDTVRSTWDAVHDVG